MKDFKDTILERTNARHFEYKLPFDNAKIWKEGRDLHKNCKGKFLSFHRGILCLKKISFGL